MRNGKSSLLEAKIQKPLISSEFVLRERLIERLNDERNRLILLHATVGYGKTVLLTQFARKAEADCVWYHLSDMDNDSMLFMQYISASVKKSIPEFNFDFQSYASLRQEDAVETVTYDFIGKISAAVGASRRNIVLILDDFQSITNENIHRIIRLIMENTGEALRIMIATKGAVPAFCFRYVLQGTADVITQKELSFTQEEVQALLNVFWDEGDLSGLAETIWRKTEGWPAGVMFAYIYLKQQRGGLSSAEAIMSEQKPALDTYFMHELYKKLPYDIQTFLVKTSILEFLSAELCNVVLHIQDARGVLEYLERENLFINKVGQSERLFRYHSLFKDFLKTMLNKASEQEILTRAAEFYLSTPDKTLAVEYALAGGNWDLMQYALESVGQELLEQGKLNILERWIFEMEKNRVSISPRNMLWMGGYYYRTGQTPRAVYNLDQAMSVFLSAMDEPGYISCMLEKARIARNQTSLEESCRLIDEILPRLNVRYNRLWYTVVMERLYNFILLGRYREALAICNEMILSTRKAGNQKAEGLFMRFSTVVYFYMGKYEKGLKLYQSLLEFNWISRDEDDIFSVEAYVALMFLFTGNKEEAQKTIMDELERSGRFHQKEDLWLVYLIQSYICLILAQDEENDALKKDYLLREAEKSILMAERHVAFFKQNNAYVKSVQLIQELIRHKLQPKSLLAAASGIMQAERKGIPLVRAMALSLLAGWLQENGEPEPAKEAAERCLAEIVWEDAFSFAARATLAQMAQQEGREEEYEVQRREMEKYEQERQLDWSFLPEKKKEFVEKLLGQGDSESENAKVKVVCFGGFQVWLPGAAEEVRWRTKKAQELFAYLFHLQGQPVDKETILLQLWPDTDRESATTLFHTTLYSIRKMLAVFQLEELIVYDKKKYAMKMNLISSDLGKMSELCRALGQNDEAFVYDCREVLNGYRGEYLGGVACEFSAAPRVFYEQKFLQLSSIAARKSMEQKRWEEAVSLLDKAIGVDPFEESLYLLIMQCFQALKDVKRAKRYYNQLTDVLRDELDVEPSAEVTAAYRLCLEAGTGKRKLAV